MSPIMLPATVWEQFGVVAIFATVIMSLLGGLFVFIRWVLNWAQKREHDWQDYITEMRKQDRESRTQDYNRTDEQHTEMSNAITTLTAAITTLTSRFDIHVAEENTRFDVMMTPAKKVREAKQSAKKEDDHHP